MIKNKKQVAAVMAATSFLESKNENSKISWTDNREIGWHNQPRKNWTKQ